MFFVFNQFGFLNHLLRLNRFVNSILIRINFTFLSFDEQLIQFIELMLIEIGFVSLNHQFGHDLFKYLCYR